MLYQAGRIFCKICFVFGCCHKNKNNSARQAVDVDLGKAATSFFRVCVNLLYLSKSKGKSTYRLLTTTNVEFCNHKLVNTDTGMPRSFIYFQCLNTKIKRTRAKSSIGQLRGCGRFPLKVSSIIANAFWVWG